MSTFTRQDFIDAALRLNWEWVDKNLNDGDITPDDILWATTTGIKDASKDIRDLAATYLTTSVLPLALEDERKLVRVMLTDPYHIVQYRLAIALYKRGNRIVEVVNMFQKALDDEDVGRVAFTYKAAA